jgi:type VI protein secretion system component VasF
VLEVYYLCLLLGYRGKYAGYARDKDPELKQMMEDLKTRIATLRGGEHTLSPGLKPGIPAPVGRLHPVQSEAKWLRMAALLSMVALFLLWVVCRVALGWHASEIRSAWIL